MGIGSSSGEKLTPKGLHKSAQGERGVTLGKGKNTRRCRKSGKKKLTGETGSIQKVGGDGDLAEVRAEGVEAAQVVLQLGDAVGAGGARRQQQRQQQEQAGDGRRHVPDCRGDHRRNTSADESHLRELSLQSNRLGNVRRGAGEAAGVSRTGARRGGI